MNKFQAVRMAIMETWPRNSTRFLNKPMPFVMAKALNVEFVLELDDAHEDVVAHELVTSESE